MESMRFATRLLVALVLLASLLVTLPAASGLTEAAGVIYHVTTGGTSTNDGSSWETAKDLQSALNAAVSGDEIWVAAGTYKPSAHWPSYSTDPRTATFTLKDGVAIYGGFVGTESSLDARNPSANVTVLSGDLDNSGTLSSGDAYHVVNTDVQYTVISLAPYTEVATGVSSSAVLDGFTITGGNADGGSNPYYSGGGMWLHQGSPTLANLRFIGNNAGNGGGGGMYVEPCDASMPDKDCLETHPTLTDVVFYGNTATGGGGGMHVDSYMNNTHPASLLAPSLTRVTFDGNSAHGGGGLRVNTAPLTLNHVTFTNNTAVRTGGGMENLCYAAGGTVTLTDVDFIGNNAASAGGLYHMSGGYANSALNGTGVRFLGNHATGAWNPSTGTYDGNGGGVEVASGTATLVNALFSGNMATYSAGGLVGYPSSTTNLVNATFSGNSATKGAAVLAADSAAAVVNLQNSIVYGNSGGTGIAGNSYYGDSACAVGDYCGTANISYSLLQGGCPSTAKSCTSVISGDPLFVDADGGDNAFGSTDDNPSLSAGSPAIDAGDNTLVPGTVTLDLAGQPRFHDDPGTVDTGVIGSQTGVVDMGAYEFQGTTIVPPDLTITKTHAGNFIRGQTGAQYTITVTNSSIIAATSGTVTVVDTLPAGLTATSISGPGWTCTLSTLTCTRSDALAASSSYPAITLVVNVAADAPALVTNVATVSGGGEANTANDTASDVTTINVTSTAPSITTQPANVTVTVGQTAEFTAAADGNPAPSVQWQVSTDHGSNWSNISGANSTKLTLSSVTADMNGNQYRAVFSNGITPDATTDTATLAVDYAPSVTTQPTNQTVAAGERATFTAVASGNPAPDVQWQMSKDGGATWVNMLGETSTTLTVSGGIPTQNGYHYQFRARFTNSAGSATTNAASLTVTQRVYLPLIRR